MLFCDGRTFREEKTSHPNVLRLGKTHEFAESSLVPQLAWERRIPYLKKPLSHFDVDHCRDSTDLLLSQIHSIVHMSNENLQRAVRKGDWHNPFSALRVLNSYVAGSWFWLSPLLQPLHKHLSSVRVLQVTFLVLMLGLSLPDAYAHDPEMHLPTLPGRISLFCSCTRRNKTGVIIWVQRRLNCLGHVLRQPVAKRVYLRYLVRARNETLSFVNRPLVGFQELLDRQGAYAVTWQQMFLPQLRRGGRFILELLF